MSEALYDSLVEKWHDFVDGELRMLSDLMPEEEVDELYDNLVHDFCKRYNYSEKTRNFVFYDRWYDTFADIFYQKLEDEGVKIIHEQSIESDWDYGKQFRFNVVKGHWEELLLPQTVLKLERKEKFPKGVEYV